MWKGEGILEITWYGYSCFRIMERGQTSVLTDPQQPAQDLRALYARSDLITYSQPGAARANGGPGRHYVISGAGEYEVGGLFVTGIPLHWHDAEKGQVFENVAYHFEYPNDLKVLHLGGLRHLPAQDTWENLDEVHALLLPVGAGLGGDALVELIDMIEPKYVLPMRPAHSAVDYEAAVAALLKARGLADLAAQASLRLSASSMPDQTQVALLKAQQPSS